MKPQWHLFSIAKLGSFVIAFLLLQFTLPAQAANRVALLIGNSNYQHETSLANPVNDAQLLAKTFQDLNFDQVIVLKNANRVQLNTALAQFKRLTLGADVALIYYSGHGMMSSNRQNYVLPTDMPKVANNANADLDLELENNGVSADKMVDVLAGSKIKVLILDACRDGPAAKFKSASKGLARMNQAETKGMLIAYATEEGKVAEDGAGKNSTYATSLAKYFAQKDMSILVALDNVAKDVETATQLKQSPTRYGNLRVDAYLNFEKIMATSVPVSTPSTSLVTAPAPVALSNPTPASRQNANIKPPRVSSNQNANTNFQAQAEMWERIKNSQHKEDFETFIRQHPNSSFIKLAQIKIQELVDIEPANLMKTDLLWRHESLAITDLKQSILEKKSDQCDAKATFLLVENPRLAIPKNPNRERYFKNTKCVVENTQHPLLMHSLANFYLNGVVTNKDEKLAFEWFSKAIDLGNINSLNSLGDLYLSGIGVEEDVLKAYNAYYKAAEFGNPAGINSMANLYSKGFIVKKNLTKAFDMYKDAASLNYGPAMYNLGTYYLDGIGIEKNPKEAFYWMNKAAEINISDAMVELVEMYQNGIGVEKNTELAAKWREKLWE